MVGRDAAQRPLIHLLSPPAVLKKIKKSYYLFRSLLSTTSPCDCHSARPVPNADDTLPRCYCAPHPALLARSHRDRFSPPPVTSASRPLSLRALVVVVVLAPLVVRASRAAEPRPVLVRWRWCTRAASASTPARPSQARF
jgi:hypothetical protein